ncbi:hypothetical protein LWI29_013648 [Acer saccharum]|uniref:Uncharacterized protein n=1 Tax=Acer saccharum TaxID=4024 RepID=A0AA39RL18_ACESA|nr:hypothetical protein LWI29_013648 [Acer saccharum]
MFDDDKFFDEVQIANVNLEKVYGQIVVFEMHDCEADGETCLLETGVVGEIVLLEKGVGAIGETVLLEEGVGEKADGDPGDKANGAEQKLV